MSQEYEDTLPAGVHILTNHVKETTDPHVDYNPVTNERIENDVAVVFLNTNEDATFVVAGKYGIPIEEGKLVIFPGGSVSHHIEMNTQKEGGFVHMWGPLEVGGSHGIVGQVSPQCGSCWSFSTIGTQQATADFTSGRRRQRQRMIEEGDDTANNNSSTDAEITGFVTITGYTDGIDPYTGEKNNTLEVRYNLKGCNGECSVFEVEDNPNFCDEVAIGELDNDNSEGDVDIIEDISTITDDVVEYINVNTSVSTFFGRPIVVQSPKGRVLACAMFKEITSNYTDVSAEAEGGAPMDDSISSASVAVWVSLVSSIVVITALF